MERRMIERHGGVMNPQQPVWCAKCCLRIAPYDARTVYQQTDYHQNCFLKLVREEAEEEKARSWYATTAGAKPALVRTSS